MSFWLHDRYNAMEHGNYIHYDLIFSSSCVMYYDQYLRNFVKVAWSYSVELFAV